VFYNGRARDDQEVLAALSDDRKVLVVSDLSYRDDALAFAKLEKVLRQNGQWFYPKPWLLSFLPASTAEQTVGEMLGGLTGDDVGPFGRLTCYPMFTAASRTPLVRFPDEAIVFVVNLIRIPATNDAATTEQMIARNRTLYDRIQSAGGVLYPVSALPMSTDDWESHFGSKWRLIREAARRYDPANILAPGYDLFG